MGYTLYQGDCLEILPTLAAQSVDAIIADPPYGTTACKWDSVIPLDAMWAALRRVIKPNGAIVLFAAQPFTSALVMSNTRWFRHSWLWDKAISGSFQNAQYGPLRVTEDICVFGRERVAYYPQMRKGAYRKKGGQYRKQFNEVASGLGYDHETWNNDYFPVNVLRFTPVREGSLHPTQKPLDLLRYLVRTYTKVGDTVLDFTMGSGTTGVGCVQEGRNFIGIELDPHYFAIAQKRIANAQPPLFVPDAPPAVSTQPALMEVV